MKAINELKWWYVNNIYEPWMGVPIALLVLALQFCIGQLTGILYHDIKHAIG